MLTLESFFHLRKERRILCLIGMPPFIFLEDSSSARAVAVHILHLRKRYHDDQNRIVRLVARSGFVQCATLVALIGNEVERICGRSDSTNSLIGRIVRFELRGQPVLAFSYVDMPFSD